MDYFSISRIAFFFIGQNIGLTHRTVTRDVNAPLMYSALILHMTASQFRFLSTKLFMLLDTRVLTLTGYRLP